MKSERRQHGRFPVMKDLAEPVSLFVMEPTPKEIPAIITNLSAGGMALVVFAHVHGDAKIKIGLNVPGLEDLALEGRVAWRQEKGETTAVGLAFQHVSAAAKKKLNHMAEDFQACETKLSFGVKDVCFHECGYWSLCHKPVKLAS